MPTDTDTLPQSGTFTPPGTSPPPDSAAPPPAMRPDQGPSAAPPQAAPPRVSPTPYGGPREPYLPLVRNRPMSQMGTDDWVTAGLRKYPGVPQGPWVPQPQDVNQLTHQISSGLGRIGSGITGPMALGLGSYRAAYLKAFLQGRQVAMQMAKEQHDMIAVRLEEQLGKEQAAIAEILAYYKDKPSRAEEMWTRLREATYGTDDKVLQQAINEKNGAGLERVMQARDGYHQSLAKLNEMRTKTAADRQKVKDAEDEAEADRRFRGVGGPQPPQVQIPQAGANAPPPDASTTPPGQPVPTPAQEPPRAASPQMQRAAQDAQVGKKPEGVPQTAAAERDLTDYRNRLDDWMRELQRDPNVPSDQEDPSIMPRIQRANPQMAEMVGNILAGDAPTAAEAASKPEFRLAETLARKINPGYQRQGTAVMGPAEEKLAQEIAEYRQPGITAFGRNNPMNRALMARVYEINPNYRTSGYKVMADFAGAGKHADTMRFMDNSIDHMDALDDYARALKNGNNRVINQASNYFKALTGSSAPTNLRQAASFVGAEVQKALGASTQAERMEASGAFGTANSPEQSLGATGVARRLLSSQMISLGREYKNGTGLDNFESLLDARTVEVLKAAREGKPSQPAIPPDKAAAAREWLKANPTGEKADQVRRLLGM